MKVETYKCDVCGAQKEKANHWWQIGIQTEAERGVGVPFLQLASAAIEITDDPLVKVFDLCGEACVQRKVSEFLGSVK